MKLTVNYIIIINNRAGTKTQTDKRKKEKEKNREREPPKKNPTERERERERGIIFEGVPSSTVVMGLTTCKFSFFVMKSPTV